MMCNGLMPTFAVKVATFTNCASDSNIFIVQLSQLKNIELTFLAKSLSYLLHLSLFNPLTPKISLVILLTVCHTVLASQIWRIWDWINL